MPTRTKVSDVMTRDVITVRPDTPSREIAALLFRHGISAVPVVDATGMPIGIVSEGDLIPRREAEREQRRDWWLRMLAEGEELNPAFVAEIERSERTARQLMSAPVITVADTAVLSEAADVLSANRIKRAPVLRDGRMVGIVSRADLVRAIARAVEAGEQAGEPARPSAGAFQELMHRLVQDKAGPPEGDQLLPWEERRHDVGEMLGTVLTDAMWSRMLRRARLAARDGETEHMLLRFPSGLCNDHGRAVNAADPGWPATLRGIAAQVFTRWNAELRPMGLRLDARVLDFPGGVPGDAGLFLAWGD